MKKLLIYIMIFIIILLMISAFFYFRFKEPAKVNWGLTFSYKEAQGLGFDSKVEFLDVLTDLRPKKLRLMTYWDDIEKNKGQFDFSNIDWQLEQAKKYNAEVILVV